MTKPFIDLHVHDTYSQLDGMIKVQDYVKFAVDNNLPAISITNHGNIDGIINLYIEAKKHNIKCLLGSEFYISDCIFDKDNEDSKQNYHLNLIAKNIQGYKNLIKLTTWANLNNFYKKPRITFDILKEYSEGLICTTACIGSKWGSLILNNEAKQAGVLASQFKELFKDDFYIEFGYHGFENQIKYNKVMAKIAELLNIKTIIGNDTHYLYKYDLIAHQILMCKGEGKTVHDESNFDYSQNYYKNREEIEQAFQIFPEINVNSCIENTYEIIDKCEDYSIEFGNYIYSEYDVPEGYTQDSYLIEMVRTNLKKRFKIVDKKIIDRVKYELSVITKMKFSGYFLIVQDYINWAKNNGIRVGFGRGSSSGSLVCYILGITEVDPLKYNLIFERFLNPERISFPDIDTDFETSKRHLVTEYLINKYGQKQAVQISTKGYLKGKSAIKAVASKLGLNFQYYNSLLSPIPNDPKIDTVEKVVEYSKELLELYDCDDEFKKVIDLAKKIEMNIQSTGVHAAGMILCHKDISEVCPIIRTKDGYATAWSDKIVEKIGLIKYDILGLSNLSVIDECLGRINNG